MKAIVVTGRGRVEVKEVPAPEKAAPEHLLIRMRAGAINSGDKLFINGAFPRGIPGSRYGIAGVSGVGTVLETGAGVPPYYRGKNVTVYRSLLFDEQLTGTWSEYAHLHYRHCAVLPDDAEPEDYAGSLVNCITPFSFLQQAKLDGHKGIICTAGTSATGIALLGICLAQNFPLISLVRTENGRKELEALGAVNVIVQEDAGFKEQLRERAEQLQATAVFDGAGGKILSEIIDLLPFQSTIYCYGFLDAQTPFRFTTPVLMRGITIKGFSNFRTATVQDPLQLEQALEAISGIIHMPHFKTKTGRKFGYDKAGAALAYVPAGGEKAVLVL